MVLRDPHLLVNSRANRASTGNRRSAFIRSKLIDVGYKNNNSRHNPTKLNTSHELNFQSDKTDAILRLLLVVTVSLSVTRRCT